MTTMSIICFCVLSFGVIASQQALIPFKLVDLTSNSLLPDKTNSFFLPQLTDQNGDHSFTSVFIEKSSQQTKSIDDDDDDELGNQSNDDMLAGEDLSPLAEPIVTAKVSADNKDREMDKLIYDLVQNDQQEAIQNSFETTALKVATLKSKLDIKIDEAIIKLQNLKNLRRHIEQAYKFANKFVTSKVTNDDGKRYVLTELENSIHQVEETLNYKPDTTPTLKVNA